MGYLVTSEKTDRVMVFIDGRNLIKSANLDYDLSKIDYPIMVRALRGDRTLKAAYFFDGRPVNGSNQMEFMKMKGFRVITRDSYDPNQRKQKEVDVSMAVKMVLYAARDNFDTAIIVSGDRDFVPAIEEMQEMGKTVEVAMFSATAAVDMMRVADRFYNLDELPIIRMIPQRIDTEYDYPEPEDDQQEDLPDQPPESDDEDARTVDDDDIDEDYQDGEAYA